MLQIFLLGATLFFLVFLFYSLVRLAAFRWFGYDFASDETGILLASVIFLLMLYKPLDHFVLLFLKKVLFRAHTRDHLALMHLGRMVRTVLDQTELANMVVNTLGETWGVRSVSVMVKEPESAQFRIISAYGLKPSHWRDVALKEGRPLLELLRTRTIPVERERVIKSFSWQEANQLTHDFERLHATCVIPMFFEGILIGSINLMPKFIARSLTSSDMKSFQDFANDIGAQFHNASLYEQLQRNNQELLKIQSELLHSAQHSAISQLAEGIAHEIHNPLTIISGKAQILLLKRDKIVHHPQIEEVLKTIVKQTKRAADITRKLLMFSDTKHSVKEPIDFEVLINDTIALLSYQVSLDQVQVVKRFTHLIPKWHGNVGELREAFLNLFLNAVQAIETEGTIEVGTRYREEDQVIEIRISDTGVGIPVDDLGRVFQPFFTTRERATGLGLFVTQQLIRGYGGTIQAEQGSDRGATFVVELPCPVKQETQGDTGHAAQLEMGMGVKLSEKE